MRNISLTIFLVICLAGVANAQSTLALHEKCAEGAKKLAQSLPNVEMYRNHYSKKFDKCFIRVVFHYGQAKGVDERNHVEYMVQVVDVFEGKVLGSLIGKKFETSCLVGNIPCNSMDEFEALIKPYMEE